MTLSRKLFTILKLTISSKNTQYIYKEQIKKQSQQTKVIFIIGGLVTMFLFIYTVMYISNRNKKTHIHWQQLLMKNQTEKATLKEEIRALSHANEINEHRYADILNQRIKLWHQSLQICVRLFKTTTSYKKIQSIETSKNKKEKEITQEVFSKSKSSITFCPLISYILFSIMAISSIFFSLDRFQFVTEH